MRKYTLIALAVVMFSFAAAGANAGESSVSSKVKKVIETVQRTIEKQRHPRTNTNAVCGVRG